MSDGDTMVSSSPTTTESGNNDGDHDSSGHPHQEPQQRRHHRSGEGAAENGMRLSASLPVATPVVVPSDHDDDEEGEGGHHDMTEGVSSQALDRVSLSQIDIARLLADEETRTRLLPDVAIAVAEEEESPADVLPMTPQEGQQQLAEASGDVDGNVNTDKATEESSSALTARGKQSHGGRKSCRRVFWMIMALLLLVVAFVVVAGLLLGAREESLSSPRNQDDLPPTPTPTDNTPATSPTAAPTILVPPDDLRPPDDFIRSAVQRISSHNLFDESTTSVQYQALRWLLTEDASYLYPTLSGGATRLVGGVTLREVLIQQRFALVALYLATAGQNWTQQANFLVPDLNTCLWYTQNISTFPNETSQMAPQGVVAPLTDTNFPLGDRPDGTVGLRSGCAQEPFELISHFFLADNNLAGTLPTAELLQALCPSIRRLFISSNDKLNGTLVSATNAPVSCPFLEGWGMAHNNLTGPLEIPPSSDFSKLVALDMTDNSLTGSPSGLSQMPLLQALRLRRNAFGGSIPSEICNLMELRELSLDGNRFTGTISAACNNMENLTDIALRSNLLTGSVNAFCPPSRYSIPDHFRFDADCATSSFDLQFESAEVECWCCTTCCDVNDKCKPNTLL